MGWPASALGARLGVSATWVLSLRTAKTVTALTHRDVAELYRELSCTPGGNLRATRYAQKFGFVPPGAWDDDTIGDPNAQPQHDIPSPRNPDADDAPYSDPYEDWLTERILASSEFQVPEAYRGGRTEHTEFLARIALRLTELGRGAEEIGRQLGVSERWVVRQRSRAGRSQKAAA